MGGAGADFVHSLEEGCQDRRTDMLWGTYFSLSTTRVAINLLNV